jgi:hypothetical protein
MLGIGRIGHPKRIRKYTASRGAELDKLEMLKRRLAHLAHLVAAKGERLKPLKRLRRLEHLERFTKNARLFTLKKGSFNSSKNICGGLINQSFFKLANLRKPEILIHSQSVSKVENVAEFWDFGNETVYDTKR